MTHEQVEPAYAARAGVLAGLVDQPRRDLLESAFRLRARALELRACGQEGAVLAAEFAESSARDVLTTRVAPAGTHR